MADYKETTVAGTAYVRCPQFIGWNPYGGTPSISFSEEQVINLADGDIIKRPAAGFTAMLTADTAGNQIPLLNPQTGLPTGQSMTFAEVYAVMYSVYIDLAKERDAAEAARLAAEAQAAAAAEAARLAAEAQVVQPAVQPAVEPTAQPAAEPAVQPAAEPTAQPAAEPPVTPGV